MGPMKVSSVAPECEVNEHSTTMYLMDNGALQQAKIEAMNNFQGLKQDPPPQL